MNGLVMTLKEDEIYMCLDALLCEQLIRCQDIDQVLLHEIIFFLSVFSISEVLGTITSIRSKLPTAACWSREEKRGNCEANLLYIESDFATTELRHYRQIIHSILRPLRR